MTNDNEEFDAKGDSGYVEESRSHQPIAALLPESVRPGVMATTVIVTQNPSEVTVDFIARIARPHQVVARVILAKPVFPRIVAALQENVSNYESQFGPLASRHPAPAEAAGGMTGPPSDSSSELPKPPPIEDIYGELKIPEALHSGVYANAVTIGHTHAEFWLDFITTFYPRAAVSARVYLAAGQIHRVLNTLARQAVEE